MLHVPLIEGVHKAIYISDCRFASADQSLELSSLHYSNYDYLYKQMDDPIQSCQLIGLAGIIVQLVLGAMSFSVLVYKRYVQKPKRAWKIWALDTSKQGVSQMLAHFVNIAISMSLSSTLSSDACIWYLTTNVLDNTIGVFLCVGILGLLQKHAFQSKYKRFQSGNYYEILDQYDEEQFSSRNPVQTPQQFVNRTLEINGKRTKYAISYFDWLVQFVIWNVIVVISKTLLFEIEILLSGPIIDVAAFLIGWIQPYETLELILVIIIVPVIMNGLAFWIQDNFLKKKDLTVETTEEVDEPMRTSKGEAMTIDSENIKPLAEGHQPLL